MAKEALAALGGLDITGQQRRRRPTPSAGSTAISDEEWVDSLNVNFLSALRITYASLDEL